MAGTYITIPDTLDDKTLINFFKGWKWLEDLYPPITVDFKTANFLSPWAVTLFSSYILWLKAKKRGVNITLDERSIAGEYLKRCGFLTLLEGNVPEIPSTEESRTVPLTRITSSSQIPPFASEVMKILQIEDEEIEGAVKYSLVELLRNVVQHSRSEIGGVAMAQYFPKVGLVDVAVADTGVGIKTTLRESYPEIDNDIKAIKFAMQPHVSSTFGPSAYSSMKDNAGLGLFFIKEIISLSGGGLFLGSGNGLANIWGDREGNQKKKYITTRTKGWNGTFAVLQLRRETIGEFDSVLRRCRELAEEARKNPSELALDFLEELPDIEGLRVIRVGDFEEDVEEAARVRDSIIIPALIKGEMLVLDFAGVKSATQSFAHALIYKILRDIRHVTTSLSIVNCTNSTREAIMAVGAYAKIDNKQ